MGALPYTCYTNVDRGFDGVYQPGDRLVRGHQGTIDLLPGESLSALMERIYARHNADDRPDGDLCPSMSVGDVVYLGEGYFSVSEVGFRTVGVMPDDLITTRTWLEVVGRR